MLLPGALGSFSDRDLMRSPAALAPAALPGRTAHATETWADAGALLLELRVREAAFRGRVEAARARAGKQAKRLAELERRLGADLARELEAPLLRRRAEALLAGAASVPRGAREAVVEDPYEPASRIRVELDPALPAAANADRLFERARRLERSRRHVEGRLAATRDARREAEADLQRALGARNVEDLEAPPEPAAASAAATELSGPRRFLTSRGLELLVGRSARENHQLTFSVARPEDLWLHARDVPGSHVILRDREGRAGAEDLREAAEVAAFHSEARAQAAVDVHVTRRKHVRAAKGAPGRVHIGYSETLRVAPRDPQGRLRRR
ncbi:MAG: NFACT RNA binding domain-containing protein [Vicinamibacteria bacterium]